MAACGTKPSFATARFNGSCSPKKLTFQHLPERPRITKSGKTARHVRLARTRVLDMHRLPRCHGDQRSRSGFGQGDRDRSSRHCNIKLRLTHRPLRSEDFQLPGSVWNEADNIADGGSLVKIAMQATARRSGDSKMSKVLMTSSPGCGTSASIFRWTTVDFKDG